MTCLDQDPLWRMASPKQVACKVQFSANPACMCMTMFATENEIWKGTLVVFQGSKTFSKGQGVRE